jgi:hypothetical protein
MDNLLDGADWQALGEIPDDGSGIPRATHTGVLRIGDFTLDVVQLEDGRRIITEESLIRCFGEGFLDEFRRSSG